MESLQSMQRCTGRVPRVISRAILHELEDEAKSPNSLLNRRGISHSAELNTLVHNILEVLGQIEDIVGRYSSLSQDQKKTWERMKFASEDLNALRSKLAFHINGIDLFIANLSASSLARIERILDELVHDVREGRKEPTLISTCEEDNEVTWVELESELIGDGISKHDVEMYKEDIKRYLLELVQDNGALPSIQDAASLSSGLLPSLPMEMTPSHGLISSSSHTLKDQSQRVRPSQHSLISPSSNVSKWVKISRRSRQQLDQRYGLSRSIDKVTYTDYYFFTEEICRYCAPEPRHQIQKFKNSISHTSEI